MPTDEFGLLKNVFGVEDPPAEAPPAPRTCCDGRGCSVCNPDPIASSGSDCKPPAPICWS